MSRPRMASRAAAVLLALAAAALFARLGMWQLRRLEERRAGNAEVRRALALPPLLLDSAAVPALFAAPGAAAGRRVLVEGVWEPQGEVVLRGRSRAGQPGVHLATPLRIAGTPVRVWVNRGWVAAPDGATPVDAPAPERGSVAVQGLLQALPPPGTGNPAGSGAAFTLRRLDPGVLLARSAGPVLPLYVQRLPAPGVAEPPVPLPVPELSEGSHLSYAVQWFAFAAIALVGPAVLLFREAREHRG